MAISHQPGAPQGTSTNAPTSTDLVVTPVDDEVSGTPPLMSERIFSWTQEQAAMTHTEIRESNKNFRWSMVVAVVLGLIWGAVMFFNQYQKMKLCEAYLEKRPSAVACPNLDQNAEKTQTVAGAALRGAISERETVFFRSAGDGENLNKKLVELEQKDSAELWVDTDKNVANLCLRDGWMVDGEKPPNKCQNGNNAVHFSNQQAGRLLTWRKL